MTEQNADYGRSWIPFSYEAKTAHPLPDQEILVWIYDEFYHGVTLGVYIHNGNPARGWWCHYNGSDDVSVTHWMPLDRPELPVPIDDKGFNGS